jgi:uncharacterized protein YjbI with pentapeptide repeats
LHGARLTEASLRNADVTHADLSSASLGGADLSQADFSSANLSNASLSEATLWEAKFGEANLTAANLRRARVTSADFTYTNLDAANFTEADLTGAMLWAARLDRTNLTRAELGATLLIELDLRTAIGLETILHRSGSVVDRRTLRASGGNLPETFLRGCGFSDWEIAATRLYDAVRRDDDRISMINEILRSQRERPSGFSSVFISYSSVDQEFVTKLHDDLQNAGVRCWFDRDDMRSGQKLHEQVERGIRKHDRLLLVLSAASMSSTWVKSEIASARQKEREQQHRVLFPIRLVSIDAIRKWKQFDADIGDDSARELREYFIPDFGAWRNADVYQAAFERLLNDLRRDDAGIDG